jgi:hypothetical protein
MHRDVRAAGPGKCSKCGMALVPEGARFGLLRHIVRSPLMLAVMIVVMAALMAAFMMFMR